MVSPDHPDPAAAAIEAFDHYAYLPLAIHILGSGQDLTIQALEPTQAIQTENNSVPMIANRATVLRVYTTSGTSSKVTNVRVSVTATRNGTALPNSPLISDPGTAPSGLSRGDIANSFNIRLPQSWLSGRVNLLVQTDARDAYMERNESNNTASITLNFETTPAMNVTVVPMNYNGPKGSFPPASTAYLAPGLMKLYPISQVNVTSRAAINVTCDFDQDGCWDDVLDYVTSLKKTDRAPVTSFYYGIIPLLSATGGTWFYGGTAGLGWVGGSSTEYTNGRIAIGLADWVDRGIDGGLIAAHELGHNLGRYHAPCDVSGDRNYPYDGAIIGNFGFDVAELEVISRDKYFDVMSYCDPQWISDYTYNALREALQNNIGAGPYPSSIATGLLVRARLEDGQTVELAPAYAINGYIDPPAAGSDYAVEFLNENGEVFESYPVNVLTASEPGIEVRRINSLIPVPAQPYTSYRLVSQGKTLARRDLPGVQALAEQTGRASISISDETLLLSWGSPQTPALVRYTVDAGQTWTTLALDRLGGTLAVALDSLPQGKIQFQIVSADSLGQTWTLDWEQ